MNPIYKYFELLNNEVPLTYYTVNISSKKNISSQKKRAIAVKEFNSNLVFIHGFYKPISRLI